MQQVKQPSLSDQGQDLSVLTDLRCRVDPLWRTLAFCSLFRPRPRGADGVREAGTLDDATMLRLVMQHLSFMGLNNSLAALEVDSGVFFNDPGLDESRLVSLIRSSMRTVDDIYDLLLLKSDHNEVLEENLFRLGLLTVEEGNKSSSSLDTGSVWDESVSKKVVLAPDGSLKAASVNALVVRLTSEGDSDVNFLKTFLMTYRSFITPTRLLDKLLERFDIPPHIQQNLSPSESLKIRSRCANVLKLWISSLPDDFSRPMVDRLEKAVLRIGTGALAESLRQPLARLVSRSYNTGNPYSSSMGATSMSASLYATSPSSSSVVNSSSSSSSSSSASASATGSVSLSSSSLSPGVTSSTTPPSDPSSSSSSTNNASASPSTSSSSGSSSSQSATAVAAAAPEPRIDLKTIFLPDFSLQSVDPEELARQITLRMHQAFCLIRPSELLDAAWTRPDKYVRAPNVCRFVHLFNHTSYLIAHSVVQPHTSKGRAREWKRWVRCGQHMWRMNNFTGVMCVVGALNGSPVYRMRASHRELGPLVRQGQQELEKAMSSTQSFKHYRDHVAQCVPPAVPYVGLLLQDLTFIETNPNRTEEGLVIWSKRSKIYDCIDQVLRFQALPYNLVAVPQIINHMANQPLYTEDELFKISLLREPRQTQ